MEVNKEEASRCLGMAKAFMKAGQHDKAVRFFEKSERLYPLPGVQSLIARCRQEQAQAKSPRPAGPSAAQTEARENRARQESGADLRGGGTDKQKQAAKEILRSAKAGQNAHYKVLGIDKAASGADIKKAYRRRSLHVHPDKNPSAEAEEAFKAVGLAYSTLSDPAKRDTYDRFGDPDPAEGGGGAQGNPFAGMRRRGGGGMGQGDMDPDDVFRMFFGGGGAPGGGGGFGGPGFRVYSNGGGFGGFQQQRGGRRQERQEGGQEQGGGLGGLAQLLPILFFILLSFVNMEDTATTAAKHWSLTHKHPFTHPLETRTRGVVKGIPFFVDDLFMRTVQRDPYKLASAEKEVDRGYETFLMNECRQQKRHKRNLEQKALQRELGREEKERLHQNAQRFQTTRCDEHADLYLRKR
ncbi:hypothetical protein TeGR_g2793 [Tetraparma gracilis]|uniref:J domain-containing protein n=1 Tax=Tetraparma gracilis TaxID=2962635 RepID=A0ABQ6MWB9_9STRA|nr:hypothetical protein TeGR_g2793 [Tetraparma gracilis]